MEGEVVISGIAGRFPECDNIESLKEMLFNEINGVTCDNRRWETGELGVPNHLGKINDPYKLDLTFFGINSKLGESMDPQTKLVIETGFSAICDAGINPSDLAGSKTATLVGSSLAETEYECLITKKRLDQTILSHAVSMQAHRIAYYLDLRGPSYVLDSSWNGGLYALRYAKDLIASGNITAALVTCTNLIFMSQVSYHYNRMGRLNEDGKTKCFSNDADGYSRSEGCVSFFLQRKEKALRNYGTLLGVNTSQYTSKDCPLADCANIPIVHHLKNLYKKSKIDPAVISYLEASGSASKVVDASELNSVAEVFLPERKEPLLIGSIKSNIGHTEAASAFIGILKTIIAGECDHIPPNIHYSAPNDLVPALVSGKLKVVTESTPLKGDYLAVNNISASGDFGHVIIKRNTKIKKRRSEIGVLPPDGIPRLVLLSGRVEEGLAAVMKTVEEMPIDEEFIALTHRVFSKGIKKHICRGYTILDEDITKKCNQIKPYNGGEKRPLWFVFTGMGSQWAGMGGTLMKLPIFAKTVQFCHNELKHLGIDVVNIVTSTDKSTFDNILNAFVGITTMQMALIDIINEIGLEPDGIIGHSFGELACAYCDGSVTAKEAILAAYNRGKISVEAKVEPGLMAAVGLGYKQIKEFDLPASIDIACHNSYDSCTISGPVEDVKRYVDELQGKGIFARTVSTGGIAYHSRYISSLGSRFRYELSKVIPEPKLRSSKWISSSVPEADWGSDLSKYSSAEYHTNNLMNSVLFEEACAHIPKDAIVVEIAPHGLLQAVLKRMLPSATNIPLTNRSESDSLKFLLAAFGKLYNEGVYIDVSKLYPPVEFPVSRGTPALATLLNWSNEGSFRPWTFLNKKKNAKISKEIRYTNSNIKEERFQMYTIDKVPVIPSAVYMATILEEFLKYKNEDVANIVFENLTFRDHVKYTGDTAVQMVFQKGSGLWEISNEDDSIASGKIDTFLHSFKTQAIKNNIEKNVHLISSSQIYFTLEGLGHIVHSDQKLIKTLGTVETGAIAEVIWNGDMSAFLDSIFKIVEFLDSIENCELRLVSFIERIRFDLSKFNPQKSKVCLLSYDKQMGLIWGQGIEILYPSTCHPKIFQKSSMIKKKPEFLVPKFTPYQPLEDLSEDNFFKMSVSIVKDNLPKKTNEVCPKLHVIEILDNDTISNAVNEILKNQRGLKIKLSTVGSDYLLQNTDMKEHRNKCTLVISCSGTFENTIQVLDQSESGFLIYKGHTPPPNLEVVTTQKIANETLYFCKTEKKIKMPSSFVLFNIDWKSNLRKELNKKDESLVFLVAQLSSLAVINDVMEQCMALENSHLLRFFFIDSELSSFDADKYKDYFRKDLRVNIFTNGVWGTSLLCPVNLNLQSVMKNDENHSIFRFNSIKSPNIDLHSLGLNLKRRGSNEKPAVYEYSGICGDEDVCGLATLDESSFYLQPDPEYQWIKPKYLSHSEASSVILAYTMAYYIFHESRYVNSQRILIQDGLSPLSQAIINVALSRGIKVFTTYDGQKENKELLLTNFPEIHQDHILNYNVPQPEVALLAVTKGEGMNLVVNTSDDPNKLKHCIKSIGSYNSKFFQVITPNMQKEFTIGMGVFITGTSLHCLDLETLLSLPIETKKICSDLVKNGFQNGDIKPIFSFNTISSSSLNIDALPTKSNVQKLVVSMKKPCLSTRKIINGYICCPSKFYLILGDRDDGWLNLLDWLIKRGARKLVVGLSTLTLAVSQRLSTLLTSHPHVNITTYSARELSSIKGIKSCINKVTDGDQLATAFVIGKENRGTILSLATIFEKTKIVAICNGSGIFQEEHSISSSTLIIKTPDCPDYCNLLEALDSLINLPATVLYMNQCEHNEIETDSSTLLDWQHIPTSIQEIVEAASGPKKAFWTEIRTSSPRYKYCRELSPVFVLPCLKRGQMKPLTRSLSHPAFEAVLPSSFENLQDLAHQLLIDLKRFPCSVLTIICSDWMWLLGLELGKLLEMDGKSVSLILLGICPRWATPESIKRVYINAVANKFQSCNIQDQDKMEKCLEILQERVRLISNQYAENDRFKGLCHLVTYSKPTDSQLQLLTECCQRNINMHIVDEGDYIKMLGSNKIANFINSNVLFEHKDCAKPMDKGYETVLDVNLSHLEE